MRNKTNIKNKQNKPNHPSSKTKLPPSQALHPPPKQSREMGNGTDSQFITCFSSATAQGDKPFSCSSMGSLPEETVLQKLLPHDPLRCHQ